MLHNHSLVDAVGNLVGPQLSGAGRSRNDRIDAAPYVTVKRRERVISRTCDDIVLHEVVVNVIEMPLEIFGAPNLLLRETPLPDSSLSPGKP